MMKLSTKQKEQLIESIATKVLDTLLNETKETERSEAYKRIASTGRITSKDYKAIGMTTDIWLKYADQNQPTQKAFIQKVLDAARKRGYIMSEASVPREFEIGDMVTTASVEGEVIDINDDMLRIELNNGDKQWIPADSVEDVQSWSSLD
jgi:hypothetical protein